MQPLERSKMHSSIILLLFALGALVAVTMSKKSKMYSQ
ncbi:hypothetical protein CAJAP_06609 [Camponotus japonicus]